MLSFFALIFMHDRHIQRFDSRLFVNNGIDLRDLRR